MSEFSKNFLPLLFNVYSSAVSLEDKRAVLAAIEARISEELLRLRLFQAFVRISDGKLLNTFFKNVIKKLLEVPRQVMRHQHNIDQATTSAAATMDSSDDVTKANKVCYCSSA